MSLKQSGAIRVGEIYPLPSCGGAPGGGEATINRDKLREPAACQA
jgi:hypothetical protein